MSSSILHAYDYAFPKNLIAQNPAHPRDSARLLIYNRTTKKIQHSTFRQLADFLPTGAVIVFNETKVLPARLTLTKETGGKVEVVYIETAGSAIRVLANRRCVPGTRLTLSKKLYFTIQKSADRFVLLKPSFPLSKLRGVLDRYGAAPLPLYIKHTKGSRASIRLEYQTIFAHQPGSVAAPTASLHFTKRLLLDLKRKGYGIEFVTLHVGLGTFAPVTDEHLKNKKLHEERYEVSRATAARLNKAKKADRPIIAVGTTVTRTLESAADSHGQLKKLSGTTDLFIQPGYQFKIVDGLITNFHVPKSSLLMLVSAFATREEILRIYTIAIQKKYRLFSFGDGMLII